MKYKLPRKLIVKICLEGSLRYVEMSVPSEYITHLTTGPTLEIYLKPSDLDYLVDNKE